MLFTISTLYESKTMRKMSILGVQYIITEIVSEIGIGLKLQK